MELDSARPRMLMHPFLLRFRDRAAERDYQAQTNTLQRMQVRAALVVGVALYLIHGWINVTLDGEHHAYFWFVRALVALAGLATLVATFRPVFARRGQRILTLVSLVPGFGVLAMLAGLSDIAFMEYTAGLMLVMIWVFLFVGLSFTRALTVNAVLLVAFNGLFVTGLQPLDEALFRYNFYLLGTMLISGISAFALEQQRRRLHARGRELEAERNRHQQRALRDHLTDLPNRYQMEQRLEQALARARRHGLLGAGLFIDLDHFKPVNDAHGHEAGDRVLQQVARRLEASVRESDTVARMGGDEFFVLLEDLSGPGRIREVARRVIVALSTPFPLDEMDPSGPTCRLGASIGICEFPDLAASPSEVIDHADRAMYEVKRSGRNGYSFYRPGEPGEVERPETG